MAVGDGTWYICEEIVLLRSTCWGSGDTGLVDKTAASQKSISLFEAPLSPFHPDGHEMLHLCRKVRNIRTKKCPPGTAALGEVRCVRFREGLERRPGTTPLCLSRCSDISHSFWLFGCARFSPIAYLPPIAFGCVSVVSRVFFAVD